MFTTDLFTVLDSVESTNNYAMGLVHAGLATHGQAWFAKEQWGGKGQREKKWISKPNENILISIVVKPDKVFNNNILHFNMLVASICHRFVSKIAGSECKIKWPNDLYFGDRKAGGILIENVFKGKLWSWSVVGIGINVNQTTFDKEIENPTSIQLTTGDQYDNIDLAKQLHADFLFQINLYKMADTEAILEYYNKHLYKKGEEAKLYFNNKLVDSFIKEVNNNGQLITMDDGIQRTFNFGEVGWIINLK